MLPCSLLCYVQRRLSKYVLIAGSHVHTCSWTLYMYIRSGPCKATPQLTATDGRMCTYFCSLSWLCIINNNNMIVVSGYD